MKRTFFVIVVPALLVAMGLAQTPAPSINTNTDQTNIKGCLGGSDGNYTVVEDNTGHIFKITTSSVDLKPHLSQDVTLIGHKASAVSSGPADNNFAVTELKMISEHCAAAGAASAATVGTPSEIASTPAAAATAPAATVSPLPETAVTPAAPATPAAETTVVTPAAPATPPAEAVVAPAPATPPAETVVTPAADATPPPAETVVTPAAVAAAAPVATVSTPSEPARKPAARHRSRSAALAAATTPAAAGASPSEHASKAASAGTPPSDTPPVAASSSAEPASAPAAVATTPTATSRGWSLWLLIAFGVLILVLGTMFPFFNRWRKQKRLERTDAPNLSLTREASPDQSKSVRGTSDQGKIDPPVTRKAA
jgi:hypothetical protein